MSIVYQEGVFCNSNAKEKAMKILVGKSSNNDSHVELENLQRQIIKHQFCTIEIM